MACNTLCLFSTVVCIQFSRKLLSVFYSSLYITFAFIFNAVGIVFLANETQCNYRNSESFGIYVYSIVLIIVQFLCIVGHVFLLAFVNGSTFAIKLANTAIQKEYRKLEEEEDKQRNSATDDMAEQYLDSYPIDDIIESSDYRDPREEAKDFYYEDPVIYDYHKAEEASKQEEASHLKVE